MDSVELESLLQQAEQLSASISGTEDFPRLEKNINQILQNSSDLWTRTGANAGASASSMAKASVLLGAKGLDLPQMQNQLKKLEDVPVLQTLESSEEQDLEGLLRNERQKIIVGLIEETSRRVLEDSQRRHWDSMMRHWQTQKQEILTSLVASQDLMVDLSGVNAGQVAAPTSDSFGWGGAGSKHVASQHNLTRLQMLYARQVTVLNEKQVQQGLLPNTALLFKEVGAMSDDLLTQEIWEMVLAVVGPEHTSVTSSKLPSVLDDSLANTSFPEGVYESRLSDRAHRQLVKSSLNYLHRRFRKYVQSLVYEDLYNAPIGGPPSVMKLAKAFLNLTFKSLPSHSQFEDGRIDGLPVWALVYVCLRLGDPESALEVSEKAPQGLGDFHPVLEELVKSGSQLSYNTITKLTLTYRRLVHKSSDVFKKLVYCVLGQCDVMDNHSVVCDKLEDYLWLKLSQVKLYSHSSSEDLSSEVLTLERLQSMLLEDYGETHFQASQQPFMYFQVLWLSGLFEDAVEFLARHAQLRVHAVHIAVVLLEQNLLFQSDLNSSAGGQLLGIKRHRNVQIKQLNFPRLVMLYVKSFEKTNPSEALQYFFLLRSSHAMTDSTLFGDSSENMFLQCVAELATETRDYVTMFGTRDFNDIRHPGLIDKLDPDNVVQTISRVASICEKRGMFEDAVYLFDLAGKKDQTLSILNRMIVPLVPSAAGTGGSRDRVVSIALEIAERYRKVGFVGNQGTLKTFYYLLDLVTFFDLYNSNDVEEALEVAERLGIVPGTGQGSGDDPSIHLERMLENFKSVSEEVKQCFPQALLCSMKMISHKYHQLSTSSTSFASPRKGVMGFDQSSVSQKKQELRGKARLLTTFVGRIPYRLPGDVNSQMAQMELTMN